MSKSYTAKQIQFIIDLKNEGTSWECIAAAFNEDFKDCKTAEAVRNTYRKYNNFYETTDGEVKVKSLQAITRLRKANSLTARENRAILAHLDEQSDVVEHIAALIQKMGKMKIAVAKKPKATSKTKMIIELLVSDTHFGLKTASFNTTIARERMRKYVDVVIKEYYRHLANYNVVGFQILFNGDLIQSATMHPDSAYSCDSTNPEQVANTIESLFKDLLVPVAQLGVPIKIIGTSGNHDRYESSRITTNPGCGYLTHIIYRSMKLLGEQAGFKHVSWSIPDEAFAVYEIFGRYFLVEHGDLLKAPSPQSIENQIARRSSQVDKNIVGIRLGHFHSSATLDMGRAVINGTLSSDEHYGAGLGFKSITSQAITFYCETTRRSPYFYTFFANLED